jgi:outer membrane protein OmpA-like peptidoglycan-associated protein
MMRVTKMLGVVVLSALFAVGCATTGYINKRVKTLEEADRATGERLSAVEAQNVSHDQRLEEAMKAALEAKDEATRAAAMRAAFSDYVVLMEKGLRFRFDSFGLSDISKNVLDEIGPRMKEDKGLILEIEGYTDPVGSEKYNLTLGQNRAQSVELYLAANYKIPIFRMYALSYGEGNLKAPAETGEGNAANRRVVLRVLGPPKLSSR